MKNLCQSFYSQLPETAEIQFAKTVSELQSEVTQHSTRAAQTCQNIWKQQLRDKLFVQLAEAGCGSKNTTSYYNTPNVFLWFNWWKMTNILCCISHVMQILFYKCINVTNISCFQTQYKKSGRQEAGSCLYSVMAETLDTQHAKQASQLQSQVHNYTPDGILLDSLLMLWSCR